LHQIIGIVQFHLTHLLLMITPQLKVNVVRKSFDYTTQKQNFLVNEFSNKLINWLDTSCPTERCEVGMVCSTKLNGNYICQCSSSSSNPQCNTGLILIFHLHSCFSLFKIK